MAPLEPPSYSGSPLAREPDVHDAASLVIIKQSSSGPVSVLMGRRHPDNAFLPNKYVFPGGRFEASDSTVASAGALSSQDVNHLMLSVPKGTQQSDMQALALTAIRETFEETGLVVGTQRQHGQTGASPGWQRFFETGVMPDLSKLRFFARAITPPGLPRRYDTRFFMVSEQHIATRIEAIDDELDDIGWVSLHDARTRDIASITHHILSDLARLAAPDPGVTKQAGVPFYLYQNDVFERVLLSHQDGIA